MTGLFSDNISFTKTVESYFYKLKLLVHLFEENIYACVWNLILVDIHTYLNENSFGLQGYKKRQLKS